MRLNWNSMTQQRDGRKSSGMGRLEVWVARRKDDLADGVSRSLRYLKDAVSNHPYSNLYVRMWQANLPRSF